MITPGKLKSLVKFTDNGATLNYKRTDILRKPAWISNRMSGSLRTIKSFIEVWPVFQRRTDRIGDHVSVLSLFLSRMMEKPTDKTTNGIRKDLNCLDVVPVSVEKRDLYISSESREASDISKSL